MSVLSKKMSTAVLGVFLFSACDNGLPTFSVLDRLRVIDIVVDQPEITETGGIVTLTPWVSDPGGNGRSLSFTAMGCPDPGVGYGAIPTCAGNPLATTIATNQAVTGLTSATVYTGAVGSFTATVPAGLISSLSSEVQFNGYAYLVTYEITPADGSDPIYSFKRIVISNRSPKNSNPTLNDIFSGGVSLTSMPAAAATFTPSFPASSAETYLTQDTDGNVHSQTETLEVTWLANAGSFEYDRTEGSDGNTFTPPTSTPAIGHTTILCILRDGRGGSAIVQKTF